jgi:hypothetical protein
MLCWAELICLEPHQSCRSSVTLTIDMHLAELNLGVLEYFPMAPSAIPATPVTCVCVGYHAGLGCWPSCTVGSDTYDGEHHDATQNKKSHILLLHCSSAS